MKSLVFRMAAIVPGLVLALSACASLGEPVTVNHRTGEEQAVRVKARSYDFDPDNIRTFPGNTIVLTVENASGAEHNFTIEDPGGKVIRNVDLPPGGTVEVPVTFSEPGTYKFYCGKPLHPSLGMKGQVVVVTE